MIRSKKNYLPSKGMHSKMPLLVSVGEAADRGCSVASVFTGQLLSQRFEIPRLKLTLLAIMLFCVFSLSFAQSGQNKDTLSQLIVSAEQINPTSVELIFSDQQRLMIDFYGENIFRVFEDTSGGIIRNPVAVPPANILVDNPRTPVSQLSIKDAANNITISSAKISIEIEKHTSLLKVVNNATRKVVLQTLKPIDFGEEKTTLVLKENPGEFFFGGGVQNGRFSHKHSSISIVNESSWTDGGVASPAPFYWSTNGYGVMWYTFKPGKYDFGAKENGQVILSHNTNYLDVFFMVNDGAVNLLNDFYQLTGHPVLLPKFAFYEGTSMHITGITGRKIPPDFFLKMANVIKKARRIMEASGNH